MKGKLFPVMLLACGLLASCSNKNDTSTSSPAVTTKKPAIKKEVSQEKSTTPQHETVEENVPDPRTANTDYGQGMVMFAGLEVLFEHISPEGSAVTQNGGLTVKMNSGNRDQFTIEVSESVFKNWQPGMEFQVNNRDVKITLEAAALKSIPAFITEGILNLDEINMEERRVIGHFHGFGNMQSKERSDASDPQEMMGDFFINLGPEK